MIFGVVGAYGHDVCAGRPLRCRSERNHQDPLRRASRGRVHPVYVWGGAILVISVPLRLMISGTHAWQRVAQWMSAQI